MPDNNTTREFSYSLPITYKGVSYPSAPANILTDGQQTPGNVFADANGNYFVLGDNGTAKSVMPVHSLDEVVVTPSKENLLSSQFNEFLTQSNDQTQVLNTPHREYNPHLKNKAIKGALSHNLWEQEHPNLSAWSQALSAVPFAVASTPLIGTAGQSVMATTAGQTVVNTADAILNGPLVQLANVGIGLHSGYNGLSDISQGKFTPSTALDLIGLPLGIKSEINVISGLRRNNFQFDKYIKNESAIPRNVRKAGVKRYTDFIESSEYKDRLENAGLGNHWQDMKDLTHKQLNDFNHFPGRVTKGIIDKDPEIQGASGIGIANPYYGITLKKDLFPDNVMPTLDHEIAHWATKNTDVTDKGFLGDIMAYNESISPNITWEDMLRKEIQANPYMTVDEAVELEKYYNYLIEPQEKRARAMSIYQQAKDKNLTTDEFIDMWTDSNGEIYDFAPEQLWSLSKVLTVDNLKKYLNKFLGITAPVGVGATLMYNKKE